MIDVHTHLHDVQFDVDRDDVVTRMRSVGVTDAITIGTSVAESREAVETAQRYDGMWASVGIHPHVFNGDAVSDGSVEDRALGADMPLATREAALAAAMTILTELSQDSAVVAIGECGLDYYAHDGGTISSHQRAWQRTGFCAHIDVAQAAELPIVIHARGSTQMAMDAYDDVYTILAERTEVSAVLHCYMGNEEMTRRFLTLPQVVFSFAGNVTYAKKSASSGPLDAVIRMIPEDRLLVETDAPYLAPVPHRGRRNESAYVMDTVRYIAAVRGVEPSMLVQSVVTVANRYFDRRSRSVI